MKKRIVLFAMLVLAACGEDKDASEKPHDKADKPAVVKYKTEDLICPQVAILEQAQEVVDYGGEKPEPQQLVAKASMKKIEGDCAYRKDDKDLSKTGIDIAFTLHLVAARGPRLGGAQTSFPYFVAIIDPADKIVSRQSLTASFTFSGSDKVAESEEDMHVFIPVVTRSTNGRSGLSRFGWI